MQGNDDVIACQINSDGTVSLNHYFNSGGHNAPSPNPTAGYTSISTAILNGYPSCTFNRQASMPGVSTYFDSNNKYYLLSASGAVSSSGLYYKTIMISFNLLNKLNKNN